MSPEEDFKLKFAELLRVLRELSIELGAALTLAGEFVQIQRKP